MHVKKKFYYKPMLCRKVKTILVIMGICCFPMISWAQVFLSGRIVDKKTNEPVVGASVYIRKNQVGDNANDNGLYRIKLPQNGTYLVEVSFIGYKTIKQSVTVNRNTTKNFFLEESTEVLNEVVVKASSQQAEINHIRKSPMAVTVVDGAKLRGRSTGIEEVLTRTSGIKVRKSGGLGSSSKMSIHGLEGKRVAIYIDGFPLNSPDGSFDINDIPIDAIKYIEIYKGIVPAEYGSDGLGGAINVVTREDECDLVGFTQEFASFGTSKTLVSVKKMFEKPGIQIGGGFFHNKSDNNYKMTYPVFETNLPSSAYQEVIRNNDYYRSTMYNVGLTFTKFWFDKIELECAFYNNKKGIQALDFDSRFSHTHGTNIMPTLTLEKKNFSYEKRNTFQLTETSIPIPDDYIKAIDKAVKQTIETCSVDELLDQFAETPWYETDDSIQTLSDATDNGLIDILPLSSIDRYGNTVKTYTPAEGKFWSTYSFFFKIGTLKMLKLFMAAIDSQKLSYDSVLNYLEKTWLNEPIERNYNGKKVCVVPLDTVKPGLKRIFDELKQAEGSYIPDYVTIIDSLTLKIEGLLRFFIEKLKIPTFAKRRSKDGDVIMEKLFDDIIADLKGTPESPSSFVKDHLTMLKYVMSEKIGWNLRNEVAHSLLQIEDYSLDKVVVLFCLILKLSKYVFIEQRES